MALLGLPALRFLESDDRDEKLMLAGLAARAVEQLDVIQHNLAMHIVSTYAKARRGG